MAGHTKMIIITSDEDIIRQFSFKNTNNQNTHIIDLNNNQPTTSTSTDKNNSVNLDFLAQLSDLNSNSDQIYKRALDSSDHIGSKPIKVPKKTLGLICTVCGDHAIGYNYDALSCASCKAFFRRNANQDIEKLRCLTSIGRCSVRHETRRKCPRCRLERCFAAGMRKEFILSVEERQRRKQRLEENRNMTSQRLSTSDSASSSSRSNLLSNSESLSPSSDNINNLLMDLIEDDGEILFDGNDNLDEMGHILLETLSVEEWITIESLRSSFLSIFKTDVSRHPTLDASDRTSALINWSYLANQHAMNFITFFRQIAEFENLDADDRFILIKYNLFPVYPILKCFYYDPSYYSCSDENNEEVKRHLRFYKLCFESNNIGETFMNVGKLLVTITEQDPAILSLLLTILMFSQGLSMCDNEPSLKELLAVNQAQSYYTKILWNYMKNKWGELEASRRFSALLNGIFRMQSVAKSFREYFRSEFKTSDTIEKLAPLMQTILHVS